MTIHPPRKSQYRGVCWHRRQGQWRVLVRKWDRRFYREFKDEETAARVYDCAARIVHGPDALPNFDDGKLPDGISREQVIAWLIKAGLVVMRPKPDTTPPV